jgi:hypothetical protein
MCPPQTTSYYLIFEFAELPGKFTALVAKTQPECLISPEFLAFIDLITDR